MTEFLQPLKATWPRARARRASHSQSCSDSSTASFPHVQLFSGPQVNFSQAENYFQPQKQVIWEGRTHYQRCARVSGKSQGDVLCWKCNYGKIGAELPSTPTAEPGRLLAAAEPREPAAQALSSAP